MGLISVVLKLAPLLSEHVRPRQGTEIGNFGVPSPLDFFWIFSSGFFLFGENCPGGEQSVESAGSIHHVM